MIKVNNLKKTYKDFELNISLEIPEGTVTGIIGQNGAGKSTTIKAILGLIKADDGSIEIFGKDSKELTSKDKEFFGVALADSGFYNELNLEDIIRILRKSYSEFDESFFRKACKNQKLSMDKKLKDFSTGMKAKVRVLIAMSHNAKLLILDEPTSGLDVMARNEVLDLIRNYLEADPTRSVMISSHISTDLESICDDIYFIHDGRVILHEDTDTILGQYGIIKVNENDYAALDKQYLICAKKEKFGYTCLTNEKMYYTENYPGIVVEKGNIDDMIITILSSKKQFI